MISENLHNLYKFLQAGMFHSCYSFYKIRQRILTISCTKLILDIFNLTS